MENILELQNLSKSYAKSDFALDQISFSLPYGSILGFVGENGAGKTTTIGCILNTLRKDGGTVKLFGKEMGGRGYRHQRENRRGLRRRQFPGFLDGKAVVEGDGRAF